MRKRLFRIALGVLVVGAAVAVIPAAFGAATQSDPTSVTAAVDGLNIAVSWSPPADTTGLTGFALSTVPAGPTLDVPLGTEHAVLVGARPNTAYLAQVASVTGAGTSAPVAASSSVTIAAPGGSFHAVTPSRLLDTRFGTGAPKGTTRQVTLTVTGSGGVPDSGVSAVALNVTVTNPVGAGFVTVYPAGTPRPTASNLNFVAGQTVPNLVVVSVGTAGQVVLDSTATANLIADVAGWFSTAPTASPVAGLFHGLTPSRLVDTRIGLGAATPGPGGLVTVPVTGAGGVPASGVSAVVLNATVVRSTASGFLTAYPTGQPRPTASNLNFPAGAVIANRVILPVGTGGQVTFYNTAGSTPLVVDVTGWFTDGSNSTDGGTYFAPVGPTRILDTRIGLGAAQAPVPAATSLPVAVAGQAGLPAASAAIPATGVIANVTAVRPTAAGFLTVYPSLTALPTASDLNFTVGAVVPNLSIGRLGADGDQLIFNSGGNTDVLVDVVGYFIGDVSTPSTTNVASSTEIADVSGTPGGAQQVTLAGGTVPPAVGDVLAAGVTTQTPDGLLSRVTDVTTDGQGQPVLATEPVTLNEAVGPASFAISAPLSSDDIVTNARPARAITPSLIRARLAGLAAINPVTQPINKAVTCSGGGSITVTGSIGLTLSVNLSVDWSWLSLRGVSFTTTLSEDASLSAAAHAAAGCSASSIPLLPTPIKFSPITFDIGPVPVVITPKLQFYLSASGTISADITSSATQHASGTLGIAWQDGGLHPIASTSSSFTYNPPALGVTATVTAKVGPRLDLYLYGVAGPYLTADAGVTLAADPLAGTVWTLTGTLDAGAGIAIPELDFDKSNPSILHYEHLIAQAPPPPGSWVEDGFGADRAGVNPIENSISTSNVNTLHSVWQYHEGGNAEFSTPVVSNGVAYIVVAAIPATSSARLVAINLSTGARIWQRTLTGTAFLSPVLSGSNILVQTGSGVFAYAAGTGAPAWSNTDIPATTCGAGGMDADGATVYAFTSTTVYSLDAATGAQHWSTGAPVYCFTALAASGGRVFAQSRSIPDQNDNQTGQIRALNAQTGTVEWTKTTAVTMDSFIAAGNGLVYAGTQFDTQGLLAFDAATGNIRWQVKSAVNFDQLPAVTASAVIVTSAEGPATPPTVRAFNASTGALMWTRNISNTVAGGDPVVANGVIYFGSTGLSHLMYAVRLDTGAVLGSFAVAGSSNGIPNINPIVVSGTVLVSYGGTLQAYRRP